MSRLWADEQTSSLVPQGHNLFGFAKTARGGLSSVRAGSQGFTTALNRSRRVYGLLLDQSFQYALEHRGVQTYSLPNPN